MAAQQSMKHENLVKNLSTFASSPKKFLNSFDVEHRQFVESNNNTDIFVQDDTDDDFSSDQNIPDSNPEPLVESPQVTRKLTAKDELDINKTSNNVLVDINKTSNSVVVEDISSDTKLDTESDLNSESATEESESDYDKGLIDENTRRKLIEDAESLLVRSELRRPKKLRSSDYRLRRKYQRRKNSASSSGEFFMQRNKNKDF